MVVAVVVVVVGSAEFVVVDVVVVVGAVVVVVGAGVAVVRDVVVVVRDVVVVVRDVVVVVRDVAVVVVAPGCLPGRSVWPEAPADEATNRAPHKSAATTVSWSGSGTLPRSSLLRTYENGPLGNERPPPRGTARRPPRPAGVALAPPRSVLPPRLRLIRRGT